MVIIMRNAFDAQLDILNEKMIRMGALCEEAIAASVKSLSTPSGSEVTAEQYVRKANEAEREIDEAERDIEAMCMKLLLRQQPVASDFRKISAVLKMISDMERIGDQSSDIAELSEHIRGKANAHKIDIDEMARQTIRMVTNAVESYVKRDLELANSVIVFDDIIDESFVRIKSELAAQIGKGTSEGELFLDLLMTAKYLERIGDHATNIAEWVEYAITGSKRPELLDK